LETDTLGLGIRPSLHIRSLQTYFDRVCCKLRKGGNWGVNDDLGVRISDLATKVLDSNLCALERVQNITGHEKLHISLLREREWSTAALDKMRTKLLPVVYNWKSSGTRLSVCAISPWTGEESYEDDYNFDVFLIHLKNEIEGMQDTTSICSYCLSTFGPCLLA